MSLEANRVLARRLYEEVFGAGNLDVADEILAPDCLSHAAGLPPVTGTDGIKLQATIMRAAFPDLAVALLDQLGEGDRVASRWQGSGTHRGPMSMPGGTALPPSERHVSWEEIRIDRFADGRIVESWFIPDRLGLMLALGALG